MKRLDIRHEHHPDLSYRSLENTFIFLMFTDDFRINTSSANSGNSDFGSAIHIYTNIFHNYQIIDLSGKCAYTQYSSASQTVTFCKQSRTEYGNVKIFDHGYSYNTRYNYKNKILVKDGQKIKHGQESGLENDSEISVENHFQIKHSIYNIPEKPLNYFSNTLSPEAYDNLTTWTD